MVGFIESNKKVLFGALSNTITHDLKEKKWQEVTMKINSTGTTRGVNQMFFKWTHLASRTKMKNSKLKQSQKGTTGHNQPVKNLLPTQLEEKDINIIWEVAVASVAGGFDALDNDEINRRNCGCECSG